MRTPVNPRETLVAHLRQDLARLETHSPPADERPISTGSPDLDRLLPAGGLRRGTLVEYLATAAGGGAGTLALSAAREACREGRALVVVEWRSEVRDQKPAVAGGRFYPPAAAAWGIDLSALLVLRPPSQADAVWAMDQALRCGGVGAVWALCDRLDTRDFRRLQLAAECGGTLGLLIRPARLRGQPTWADVQWEVRSTKYEVRNKFLRPSSFVLCPWRLSVEMVRCRGAAGGKRVLLELDEAVAIWREVSDAAAHSLSVSAGLADPTPLRRA